MNFDRIAHLAKLVFHTKWVLISLVDKDEQYVIWNDLALKVHLTMFCLGF